MPRPLRPDEYKSLKVVRRDEVGLRLVETIYDELVWHPDDAKMIYDRAHNPRRIYLEVVSIMFMTPKRLTGFVYAIDQGEEFSPTKIGYTQEDDIAARLNSLQTGNPKRLRVVCSWPGSPKVERFIHEQFAKTRLCGEWFAPTAVLTAFVAMGESVGLRAALESLAPA